MTRECEALDKILCKESLMLTPDEIAPLLDSTPQTIRKTAKEHPELVGFPFTYCGKQMRIPKQPFLEFIGIGVNKRV